MFQSWAMASFSTAGLVKGGLGFPCLSRTKAWMELCSVLEEELVVCLLVSRATARLLRTWLCLQVYRPCVRLVLHPVKMCLSVAGVGQRAQVGSSPYQSWRFFGDGSVSYVALIMKPMVLDSVY